MPAHLSVQFSPSTITILKTHLKYDQISTKDSTNDNTEKTNIIFRAGKSLVERCVEVQNFVPSRHFVRYCDGSKLNV